MPVLAPSCSEPVALGAGPILEKDPLQCSPIVGVSAIVPPAKSC